MKLLTALVATTVAALGLLAPANAALPPARYVKKAVFVRLHWDRSFFNHFSGERGKTTAQMNDMLRAHYDDVRAAYLNTAALQNVKFILLEDFDRDTGPMSSYLDSAPLTGGDTRLINAMKTRLKTGNVNRTTPNGTNHLLGRTLNLVFVWGNYGGQQGVTDTIGGLVNADANIFISTSGGGFTYQGQFIPLTEQLDSAIRDTMIHEIGHILGAEHGTDDSKADCRGGGNNEIMCGQAAHFPRQRRFGSANLGRTTNILKRALGQCSTAFSNYNSCEQAVIADCSMNGDYTQIQPCIDFAVPAVCSEVCTTASKNAIVVINSLDPRIQCNSTSASGCNVVVAPGPAQ